MDDDELAELRAQRAAGGRPALAGPLGNQLEALRRRAAASASTAREEFFEDSRSGGGGSRGSSGGAPGGGGSSGAGSLPQHGPSRPPAGYDEDKDNYDDDDDEAPSVLAPETEVEVGMDFALRSALPLSFGAAEKPSGTKQLQEAIAATKRAATASDALIGPPAPAVGASAGSDSGSDDDDDDGGHGDEGAAGGGDDPRHLPVTHEAVLKGHSKLVCTLDVEHSGSRLASGGYDYCVRLYDFNGMKRDLKPFRELEPCGAHQIRAVSWSPSGENLFVVSGSSQPKVFDRDGRELGEFGHGDMYIRDLKHTKGHIMGCTSGQWHPNDKAATLTASEDGSLRLWDVSFLSKEGGLSNGRCQTAVIKPQQLKPGRQAVTACCFSPDGRVIAGGISDGSIQMWSSNSNFASAAVGQVLPPKAQVHLQNHWSYSTRPLGVFRAAHPPGEDVTSLRFSRDGQRLLSRALDGSLKIWDVRSLKAPVCAVGGLESNTAQTAAIFSPDEALVVAAVNASRDGASGAVAFYEAATLKLVRRLGVAGGSAVALHWHSKLNQIFVGAGDSKSGAPRVLYDPDFSERGALLAAARAPRQRDAFDMIERAPIPAEFVAKKEGGGGTRKRQRDAQEAKARTKKMPQAPQGQFGRGGALGQGTGGTLLTQYLLEQKGMLKPGSKEADPRAVILRHAAAAAAQPMFIDNAYAETQPGGPIFSEPTEGEDEDEEDEEHR